MFQPDLWGDDPTCAYFSNGWFNHQLVIHGAYGIVYPEESNPGCCDFDGFGSLDVFRQCGRCKLEEDICNDCI